MAAAGINPEVVIAQVERGDVEIEDDAMSAARQAYEIERKIAARGGLACATCHHPIKNPTLRAVNAWRDSEGVFHEVTETGGVLCADCALDHITADADEQLALSDPTANTIGAFHAGSSGAPDTERLAALAVFPRSGTSRERVLLFIAQRGKTGATDEEISEGLSMRLYTAAPRRHELVEGGWVTDSGIRRPTSTGTDAAVWMLTPRAREHFGHA